MRYINRATTAFVAARPFHSLTIAHLLILVWVVLAFYIGGQYLGSLIFPGLGADPSTFNSTPWTFETVEKP